MKSLLRGLCVACTLLAFVLIPIISRAADDVYYDVAGVGHLYIKAEACKVANCIDTGTASDWYNYSTTSENIVGEGGDGKTLIVSPGDTVTLRGTTSVTGQGAVGDPIYGISFTNGTYLTIESVFEGGYEDIDGDTNDFIYASEENITLSGGLDATMNPQIGAITGKIKDNTPDGTIIEGKFFVVDPSMVGQMGMAFNFFDTAKAQATDQYLRSTTRMQVSVPSTSPTPTPTPTASTTASDTTVTSSELPDTGSNSGTKLPIIPIAVAIIGLGGLLVAVKIAKTKKQNS